MKAWHRVLFGAVLITGAVILFKALIGNNALLLFAPRGTVAAAQARLIETMVLLMLIIVVPLFILLFTFAWKYRAGNEKAAYKPDEHHGPWSQIVLWLIPAAMVVVLGTLTWNAAHELDPYRPISSSVPPVTIEVVALPWKWLFLYPAQNIATVNYFEFPVATPVHFELTADGPMSSFWIPQLGSQIYAMAAMQTQLNLIASSTGRFPGKDMEINGTGYAGMTFAADSVSPADFATWVASMQAASNTLNGAAYRTLAMPSTDTPPMSFSSIAPGLYEDIILQYMPPALPSGTQNMDM